MPLAPKRMSHNALEASARLLRVPGVRSLVRSSFLEYVHLRALRVARLQGLPPHEPGAPPGPSR